MTYMTFFSLFLNNDNQANVDILRNEIAIQKSIFSIKSFILQNLLGIGLNSNKKVDLMKHFKVKSNKKIRTIQIRTECSS